MNKMMWETLKTHFVPLFFAYHHHTLIANHSFAKSIIVQKTFMPCIQNRLKQILRVWLPSYILNFSAKTIFQSF